MCVEARRGPSVIEVAAGGRSSPGDPNGVVIGRSLNNC